MAVKIHNLNNGGCLIRSSLEQMGGIIVQTVKATAVSQNLHQEAPHLLLKDPEAAIACYILCTLVLRLYTCDLLGAEINFRLAVAKNASLYGAITPQLHNVSPLTDIVVVHSNVSNGGGNSGETGDPSGSGGGSGGIGGPPGSNDGNSAYIVGPPGSNDDSNNADIGGPPGSSGSGHEGGIAGPPGSGGGNIEAPNDNDPEPRDNDAVRASFEGVLFLIMAMVAGIATAVMDHDGSEHTQSEKHILIGINISAAICFFSSFFGLMGVVMRMLRGRSVYPHSLIMAQKISLIISVGFMLVTMIMIFVSVHLKLAE